jgi:hypothetical protein
MDALDGLMRFFSFLGEENFFSAFIPVVYWCVDATLGIRLLTLLVFSNFINGLGKWVFRAPRPYWVDARVKALSIEPSYGLPSGHAQNAVGIWWMVAGTAGKTWARVAAVFPREPLAVGLVFRYVRYALVALGALWLAPWLFLRLRLAEKDLTT